MKIMWKPIDRPEEFLQKMQSTVEQISLPGVVLKALQELIVQSQELLPPVLRTFQDWRVGLLQRFRVADLDV
jgi:hypothetical protein